MERRRFLMMLGMIPAALALPPVTGTVVETMHRQRFWSLAHGDRLFWEMRLQSQWGMPLKDTRQFWFQGTTITGVERIKRNESGRPYPDEDGNVAVEILGFAA